jgi:ribosomal protein L32E
MRVKERAKPALVGIGYRGPRKVRGWHPRGSPEIMVRNVQDIQQIVKRLQEHQKLQKKSRGKKKSSARNNKEMPVIRIASSVGNRKKIDIMRIAHEHTLYVANPRIDQVILTTVEDVESYVPLKKYITAWKISGKLLEEDREEIEEAAQDEGIEVIA